MADFNASAQVPVESYASTKIRSNQADGKVRMMVSTYTVPASSGPQIGDTITWGTLPKSARILGNLSKLYFAAGAASSTLNVGDSGSAARYLAATSVASAGSAICEAANASGATYATTAATEIKSTVAGAALGAAQVITLHLAYVQD